MRRRIQNVLANRSGCRLPSSRPSSAPWMKGWPRYGKDRIPNDTTSTNCDQGLGDQPRARTHPQGLRGPNFDKEASPFRISCFLTKLRYLHAILWTPTNISRLHCVATITNCRSTCGIEARYRCRLARISPAVPGGVGLLLQPHRTKTSQRPVPRGHSASLRCGWVCR
jgi:hypothetical protein